MATRKVRQAGILDELNLADATAPTEEQMEAAAAAPESEEEPETEQEAEQEESESAAEPEQETAEEEQAEQGEEQPPAPVDPARFAALEQSLQEEKTARAREKTAMLREIQGLRARRREGAEGGGQPATPRPPARIPVDFDESGQPYVSPENLARVLQQVNPVATDPVTQFGHQHRRMAESVVLTNPVGYAKANLRFQEAYRSLDEAVRFAQMEAQQETTDMDSMMNLIEDSGVAESFMKEYPDIAASPRDIEDFLQASISLNPRRYQRVLEKIAGHEEGDEPTATPAKGISAVNERVAERMNKRPVPLRKMGSRTPPKARSKIDALSDKSPFEWTEADRKAFLKEMESVDSQEA